MCLVIITQSIQHCLELKTDRFSHHTVYTINGKEKKQKNENRKTTDQSRVREDSPVDGREIFAENRCLEGFVEMVGLK